MVEEAKGQGRVDTLHLKTEVTCQVRGEAWTKDIEPENKLQEKCFERGHPEGNGERKVKLLKWKNQRLAKEKA